MTDPQRQIAALHYAAACIEQGAENEQALTLGFPPNDLFATKAALYAIAADLRRQATTVTDAPDAPDAQGQSPARAFLLSVQDGFGFWCNEQVVLMVREGTYFGAGRPGHTLPQDVYPCDDVDEALARAGVAPDALGEGY